MEYVPLGKSGMKVSRYAARPLAFAGALPSRLGALFTRTDWPRGGGSGRRLARSAGALAWTTSRAGIGTIALGLWNEEQWQTTSRRNLTLKSEKQAKIEAARRSRPLYPFWHRAMLDFDRPTPSEGDYRAGHSQTIGL